MPRKPRAKATFSKGQSVCFNSMDLTYELEELIPEVDIKQLNNKIGTVMGLETYTELGDKDYEYYNVRFKFDGCEIILIGISGYHLKPQI